MSAEQPTSGDQTPQFETVFSELQDIVRSLETGDLTLDESIRAFEKGMGLADACKALLHQAELKITTLQRGFAENLPNNEPSGSREEGED